MLHNNHINIWGVTEEELYKLAHNNTSRIYRPDLRPMKEVLAELIVYKLENGEDLSGLIDEIAKDNYTVYVLTNHIKNSGAACVLYDDILENFAKDIDMDFYILPSSIHELILVPDDGYMDAPVLINMVRHVNIHEVAKEDLLSDNIYKYVRGVGVVAVNI